MLVCLIALTACGPPAGVVRPDQPPDSPARATALEREGRFAAAAEIWTRLAARGPDQDPTFALRAADAWLMAGHSDAAAAILADFNFDALDRRHHAHRQLLQAELAWFGDDPATAQWLLDALEFEFTGTLAERRDRLQSTLAELHDPFNQAFGALQSAVYTSQFTPELALALLIEQPLSKLQTALDRHGHRPELLPWLDLAASARMRLLDPDGLAHALAAWERRYPQAGYSAEQADAWLQAWRSTQTARLRIVVALPGIPALQAISDALRNGLMAAWLDQPAEQRGELLFRKLSAERQSITAIWFEARELEADLLIGPLERHHVDELLTLPDSDLPILLLNQPSDPEALANRSRTIHALALLAEEEAELAAVQALVSGHRRALLLAQASSWGDRVAAAFRGSFELGGGRVIDRLSYPAEQADHSQALIRLLQLDRSEQRANRLAAIVGQPIGFEAHPRTDIDLVFLAARANDGRQIRPQLRFFGLQDVRVLGTSQLVGDNGGEPRTTDLVDVTVPLAPWFVAGEAANSERLRYRALFPELDHMRLSMLHALGRDAFDLARWLSWLQTDPDLYLAGRTARLRALPDGRIERDLPFVELREETIRPLQ